MDVASHTRERKYVACRACGATHAEPYRPDWEYLQDPFGLCESCVRRFRVLLKDGVAWDGNSLNLLLGRHLTNTAKRAVSGRIVGRCEAISASKNYQCAMHAQEIVNGRRLCTNHANDKDMKLACEELPLMRSPIFGLITLLAERDKDFASELNEFVESYKRPRP